MWFLLMETVLDEGASYGWRSWFNRPAYILDLQ
jgi:hypothetical protein